MPLAWLGLIRPFVLLGIGWMRLILYRIKVISGVLHYGMRHSSNKLKGRLHFFVQDTIISKGDHLAVMHRKKWALVMIGETLNQLFSDLAAMEHEVYTSP